MDNSNPLFWFISFLDHIRVNVLEQFVIPGLGISWWHFVISLAVVSIVVTVLINAVRIGVVSRSNALRDRPQKQDSGILTQKSTTVKMNDGFGGKYTDTYGKSAGGIWLKR